MNTDLSFITNEENQSLKKRFEVLIKDTSFFDCLVGYFYSSGFHAIYHSLENTEKIRILIGISTSRQTFELLENAKKLKQQQINFSLLLYQLLRPALYANHLALEQHFPKLVTH